MALRRPDRVGQPRFKDIRYQVDEPVATITMNRFSSEFCPLKHVGRTPLYQKAAIARLRPIGDADAPLHV